jgi:hypothetical protein
MSRTNLSLWFLLYSLCVAQTGNTTPKNSSIVK